MHLVVVTHRPEPLEAAVAALSARQGISAYEARTRVGGELPRIVAVIADREPAHELMRGLLADRFEAAVIDARSIEHDDDREIAAALELGSDGLEVTLRTGATRTIAYGAMTHALNGVRTTVESTTSEAKTRNFSAGRAVLTGGLVISKTTTTSSTRTQETREGFLYLRHAEGEPTLALYERRLNYAFLGRRVQPSSFANFQTLLGELASRAPGLQIDRRMLRPVGLGTLPLAPGGVDAGSWKSDVAAAVLALTWR